MGVIYPPANCQFQNRLNEQAARSDTLPLGTAPPGGHSGSIYLNWVQFGSGWPGLPASVVEPGGEVPKSSPNLSATSECFDRNRIAPPRCGRRDADRGDRDGRAPQAGNSLALGEDLGRFWASWRFWRRGLSCRRRGQREGDDSAAARQRGPRKRCLVSMRGNDSKNESRLKSYGRFLDRFIAPQCREAVLRSFLRRLRMQFAARQFVPGRGESDAHPSLRLSPRSRGARVK